MSLSCDKEMIATTKSVHKNLQREEHDSTGCRELQQPYFSENLLLYEVRLLQVLTVFTSHNASQKSIEHENNPANFIVYRLPHRHGLRTLQNGAGEDAIDKGNCVSQHKAIQHCGTGCCG